MVEKKKKRGEENILPKNEVILQALDSELKPTTIKFAREGLREFVEYDYDKNIAREY